jgi:phosphate transport system permease protein
VPEIRIAPSHSLPEPGIPNREHLQRTTTAGTSAVRPFLLARGSSALADRGFYWLMVLCALSIFAIVVLIVAQLVLRSDLAWDKFHFDFFFKAYFDPSTGLPNYWDPVNGHFSALPFVYGTVVSSLLSLLLAVPLAIGVAVFLTEMCPRALRGPLAFITELLAAIPSIIYGLWAVFALVPLMREYVNPALVSTHRWTGFL